MGERTLAEEVPVAFSYDGATHAVLMATTMDFHPGDIHYVKRQYGHYIRNVGDTDVQYVAVFRSPYYAEESLSYWLTHTPPALVAQHLNIDEATIAKFPSDEPAIMPA